MIRASASPVAAHTTGRFFFMGSPFSIFVSAMMADPPTH